MTESSLRAQKLPVLEVEDLAVSLPPGGDRPNAVEHVSFTVNEGEVTCLIGESGSGKSVIASTVMGLLPKGLAPAEGSVKLLGWISFAEHRTKYAGCGAPRWQWFFRNR